MSTVKQRSPGKLTLQHQLSISFMAGVFGLALFTSMVSAWQGARQISDTLMAQDIIGGSHMKKEIGQRPVRYKTRSFEFKGF